MHNHFITPKKLTELLYQMVVDVTFSMLYKRVNPKCLHCNKSKSSWRGLSHCPVCGNPLDSERFANAKITYDSNINGNLFQYFDTDVNENRNCRIENIIKFTINDVNYFVINID